MIKWLILLGLLEERQPKTEQETNDAATGCAILIGIVLWTMGGFWLAFQDPQHGAIILVGYSVLTAILLTLVLDAHSKGR